MTQSIEVADEQPISVDVKLRIVIHRHNGRDDDDCEVMIGSDPVVRLRPDKVAKYLKSYLKDTLPGKIKKETGIDVEAA